MFYNYTITQFVSTAICNIFLFLSCCPLHI